MKRWLRRIWLTVYHTISFVWFAVAIIVLFFWIRSCWIEDGVQIASRVTHTATDSPDGFEWRRIDRVDSRNGQVRWRCYRYRVDEGNLFDSKIFGDGTLTWSGLNDDGRFLLDALPFIEQADAQQKFLGFALFQNDETPDHIGSTNDYITIQSLGGAHALWIPYWAVTLSVSFWPLIWLLLLARGIRNLKRMARGHCGKCNYDLRGIIGANLADGGANTCPECGAACGF